MSFSPYAQRGDGGPRHLDLTGDREVVYCHGCSNEWYKDEHDLVCPRCNSEICEIITPENDPRDIPPEIPYPRPPDHVRDHGYNHPDPDEDDIANFQPGFFPPPNMNRNPQNRAAVDPSSDQEVFQRFQETLNILMGFNNPAGQPGRANRETVFGGPMPFGAQGPTGTTSTRIFRGPGRATFSITTTNFPGPGVQGGEHMNMGHDQNHMHNDDFDMIFGNAMGSGNVRSPQAQYGQPPLDTGGLHGLLSLVFPGLGGPNAVHGDAVYSQEALDRIITQLMEVHPQSNAAPPATEDAIEKLEKKKLDREMTGESGKAECTICIDEINIGDEVTVLPCKHWFHGECVVLWLKEHNTCPICRTPIEKREGNGANGDPGASADSQRRASEGGPAGGSGGSRLGGWFGVGSGSSSNPWANRESDSPDGNPPGSYQHRGARSPEERQARLNAIRNLAGPSSYGQPAPDSPRDRRDSWSPTSPPPGSSSARERSPTRPRPDRTNSSSWNSQRSGRSSHHASGSGGGSSNPINWLRDRFSGSGGGSNNSSSSNNTNANNGSGRRRS